MDHESMEDRSEGELWDSFRSGNDAAFDFIYQKYFDRLYNYGRQFTPHTAIVEDAIQELFIELRRRSSFLSPTDSILPYLYNAFRRKIIRLRDKELKNQDFDISKSFEITVSVEDEIITNDLEKEDLQKLQSAIQELSPKYREIIYHFYYENLSYTEIQEVLGFDNVKSVRNLLYKALKSLRKGMTHTLLLTAFLFSLLRSEENNLTTLS
ncbi:MAG: RNA polymerase sigma factor (sigma-70 family) [Cyclobacteriaceae bacterium]|jgi:RNA polymerase sigma factor (sigma-70 family)